jgi:hypothetical protein
VQQIYNTGTQNTFNKVILGPENVTQNTKIEAKLSLLVGGGDSGMSSTTNP